MTRARKAPASSTEPRRRQPAAFDAQIDAAVERWCAAGLVQRTDWAGRPLLVTPLPKGRDVRFDPERVERVLKFFRLLRQVTGKWSGHTFLLLDWQVRWIIAPVFGLVDAGGRRVIRTVWVEIPRKNGKSTLSAGLGLCLAFADREQAAEVYAAAGDKTQAGNVFRPARIMAQGSDALRKALGARGIQRGLLEHPTTRSIFRVLSSDGARQHGLNVHGAVIDEVHVHKTPDLIEALETGVGAREQPLVIFITTADAGRAGSIYNTKREYLENACSGAIVDPTYYGVLFGVSEQQAAADPYSDATLAAANPGAGWTVTWDYLRAAARRAANSPSELNGYLRLHLNVRTRQTFRWLPLNRWDAGGQFVDDDWWHGRTVVAGLDLSSTTDLTAYVLLAQADDRIVIRPMFWLPDERAHQLGAQHSIPFTRWAAEGFLRLTEGNVVDYRQVRADIIAEHQRLGVRVGAVGYDPWNATETVLELEAAGVPVVEVPQGYKHLSSAAKTLERAVMGSTATQPLVVHGGHPIMRWCVDCVEVRQDPDGNIKPVKPDRSKSSKRIDGVAAAVNALVVLDKVAAPTVPAASAPPTPTGTDFFRPAGRLQL